MSETNGHALLPNVGFADPQAPFDQKAHDLMLQSIDKVAGDWVQQLQAARANSERVEALVLERVAKVKSDVTQLYLLGSAALAEARRGDSVSHQLASELDRMAEEMRQ